MAFYFGDLELVTGFGIVVLAPAIGATTMVLRNGELLLALMAFANGNDPVDVELAVFDLVAIFDRGRPAFMHKTGHNACGFAHR